MTLFETIKDQDKKLGEILLEKKIIDEEQIQHVIVKSKEYFLKVYKRTSMYDTREIRFKMEHKKRFQ